MSAEKIVNFRERATPGERCGRCTHPLGDHEGHPCIVPVTVNGEPKVCPCPSGVRSDVFLCLQVSELIQGVRSLDMQINQIRLLVVANGMHEIVENPMDGSWRIQPKLIVKG